MTYDFLNLLHYISSTFVVFLLGYAKRIVPTLYDLFVLALFCTIGIVIGSDLPDVDSRTAPVHDIFGVLTFGTVTILSMAYFRFSHPVALLLGIVAAVCYIELMPPPQKIYPHHKGWPYAWWNWSSPATDTFPQP